MRYYGAHLSVSHGFNKLAQICKQLDITAIQIHPTAPQRYATKPIDDVKAESIIKHSKNSPLRLVFLHAIYLINLAQPNKQKFHLSKVSLVTYLQFQHQINHFSKLYKSQIYSPGVIVHVGSAKHYKTEEEAYERAAYGLQWVLDNSPKDTTLLLEVSAGAGMIIGDRFEELALLRKMVKDKHRIKFALDTQHMFVSGYDIVNHPKEVAKQAVDILGKDNIEIIHLNDSKYPLNARKDRHENLGQGEIGLKALKEFINQPGLKHVPVVLETPACKSIETLKPEIQVLRSIL